MQSGLQPPSAFHTLEHPTQSKHRVTQLVLRLPDHMTTVLDEFLKGDSINCC
jgi:hypothetical protein